MAAGGWKFMTHDKWENALFCHWRYPCDSPLGRLLEETCPFRLDRWTDAAPPESPPPPSIHSTGRSRVGIPGRSSSSTSSSAECFWLGLVLLCERNVGPGLPLLRAVTQRVGLNVTHLGANVRTYVEGDGIFFYSLECDSLLATVGANVFGIPYKIAHMSSENKDAPPSSILQRSSTATSSGRTHSFRSERKSIVPHGNSPTGAFKIAATWEVSDSSSVAGSAASPLSDFFVERYRVYTRKYGVSWRGNVKHDPWPLRKVGGLKLEISGVETPSQQTSSQQGARKAPASGPRDRYHSGAEANAAVDSLVLDMSSRPPDHVCFSPGVGPVEFDFLKPGMVW